MGAHLRTALTLANGPGNHPQRMIRGKKVGRVDTIRKLGGKSPDKYADLDIAAVVEHPRYQMLLRRGCNVAFHGALLSW
jgi:hypothetical protein